MLKSRATADQKRRVSTRAGHSCEYCKSQSEFSPQSFIIEHIYPVSLGGETVLDNLALACAGCNGHKYNKIQSTDPVTNEMAPLFHPRQQLWSEHFCWSDDYLSVVGVSAIGRASVVALKLNRPALQNLRKVLYGAGLHPLV